MIRTGRLLPVALLFSGALCVPAAASEDKLEQRVKDLEKEVAAAKKRLAALRDRVKRLEGRKAKRDWPQVPRPKSAPKPAPKPGVGGEAGVEGKQVKQAGRFEDVTITVVIPGDDAGRRAMARKWVAVRALRRILGARAIASLRGPRLRSLRRSLVASLRDERVAPNEHGAFTYRATLNLGAARARVLRALGGKRLFSNSRFLVVANQLGGPGPDAALETSARAAANDVLNRHDFRHVSFSSRTDARLVCTIRGRIKFERMPASSPQAGRYAGYLRCQGVVGRVYDRRTRTVLARFTLRSVPAKREACEATRDALHQPWVAQGDDLLAASEKYASFVGQAVASRVAQSFVDDLCLGKGALPARPAKPRAARYTVRFLGWTEDEVTGLAEGLALVEGFSDWRLRVVRGGLYVYRCSFKGRAMVKRVREALKASEHSTRVTKRGVILTVRRID